MELMGHAELVEHAGRRKKSMFYLRREFSKIYKSI